MQFFEERVVLSHQHSGAAQSIVEIVVSWGDGGKVLVCNVDLRDVRTTIFSCLALPPQDRHLLHKRNECRGTSGIKSLDDTLVDIHRWERAHSRADSGSCPENGKGGGLTAYPRGKLEFSKKHYSIERCESGRVIVPPAFRLEQGCDLRRVVESPRGLFQTP
ncbi:hypothetical protein BV22DRAFT_510291 [Leucogyrophana mollusca]|uniref:Uncharacterized protein n=1 Tax=Leucogyrophana mollusca TaxID=85980 RepID=A0ACB8BFS0_9AGAM|nr:hypothetical protein BV22DRAFT_510291 [Leucogyrophana mollusca]